MFGCFLFVLAVFISSLNAEPLQDITSLEVGKSIAGQLSGGEEHLYQMTLGEGDFARVIIDQINIDLVLNLQGVDGKQIAVCDQESRNQGREKLEFVADKAGTYRLDIRPTLKSAPASRYEIRLDEIRRATERDRLLFNASQSFLEANRLEQEGNYEDALPLGEQTLQIFEQAGITENEEYANALNLVANIHTGKQDYAKADSLYQRALEIREKVLGAGHPDVAASCIDMARFYSLTEDTAKTESFALRAVTIREKTLDTNHFYTGYALLDYGRYLFDAEKYAEAEEMLKRALFILEKSLNEDHPQYAMTLHSLGFLYDTTGDFNTAIQLYRRELISKEKANGKDSLPAAKVLNYIARVNYRRGELEEAEALYQGALDINTKLNDENGILVAQSNLANIHMERGDYQRSEEMYKEILERRKKPAKPISYVAHALVNLGEINNAKGDYTAAEAYLKRSMSIADTIWKEETMEKGDILTRLATAYIGQKDYAAASEVTAARWQFSKKSMVRIIRMSPRRCAALGQIALLNGESDSAEPMFRRALTIVEKAEGIHSPTLLEPLNGLADVYTNKLDIAQAMEFQSRANAVVEHNLALAIATGSERQKLSSLLASASNMDRNIALHIGKAPPENSKAAELAATTVLRFKGRVLDSMADTLSSLRLRSDPEDRNLLDQLNDSSSQLAQRILFAPELAPTAESRALEEKIEKLQDEISSRQR